MLDDLVTQLRELVVRSLVLAVRAREKGDNDLSAELIAHAAQCEQRAGALEVKHGRPKVQ